MQGRNAQFTIHNSDALRRDRGVDDARRGGIVGSMIHDAAGIVGSMMHDAPGGLKPTPAMPGMDR
jgi:hypothetical protein